MTVAGDPFTCPTHGIPDCSPLLNGCSWVIDASERLLEATERTVTVTLEIDTGPIIDSFERAANAAWGLELTRSLRILAKALPKVDRLPAVDCSERPVVTAGHFAWGSVVSNA